MESAGRQGVWARNLTLLRMLTWRELVTRYRGALFGLGWTILSPLLLMLLYTTVFAGFLRLRLSTDTSPTAYAFYLLAGLLPWNAFVEAVSRSVSAITEHKNLVQKVVFPLELIPLSTTCGAFINHGIALGLFLIAVLVTSGWSPMVLLLPLLFVPLLLLMAGVSFLLASFGVLLRDVGQAITFVLTAWLFLTPILYPSSAVPARVRLAIEANPFTAVVEQYRRLILEGRPLDLASLAWLYVVALLVCAVGVWWFGRTKAVFADLL